MEGKKKFFDYANHLYRQIKEKNKKVHTLVLSSYYKDNGSIALEWHGTSDFNIPYKSLYTLDADERIENIKSKNEKKEELNEDEIADLRILTFMKSKDKSHEELLIESVRLTNEAVMDEGERVHTKALQSYLAKKFIKTNMKYREVMRMIEVNSGELGGIFERDHEIMRNEFNEELKKEQEIMRNEFNEELKKEQEIMRNEFNEELKTKDEEIRALNAKIREMEQNNKM